MQNISWTYSLHSQMLLNEMQQETNKNFYLASGLNSFNFQDRENVDIRSQLQTLEHHPRWPLLYFTVSDSFCFWPLLLIALVLGSRGCVWVRRCSKHTVLRARSDHVGSFSASSGGHTGCINRQRDESPARVTSRVTLVVCERCRWSMAGFPQGSWVHLSHLVAREGCPHTLWQTGGRTPKRRWSSWDGCSGLQKNFFEVTPKSTLNEEY